MAKDAIALVLDEPRTRGEAIPPSGWALVESVDVAACRSASSRRRPYGAGAQSPAIGQSS
jgi:hypothetical protein